MVKKETIQDHLNNKPSWVVELFKKLDDKISKLDKVSVKVTYPYIGYKVKIATKRPRLFIEVHLRKTKIELHLRNLDYKNYPEFKVREAPDTHKWTLTKLVDIDDNSNFENVFKIIKESYTDVLY